MTTGPSASPTLFIGRTRGRKARNTCWTLQDEGLFGHYGLGGIQPSMPPQLMFKLISANLTKFLKNILQYVFKNLLDNFVLFVITQQLGMVLQANSDMKGDDQGPVELPKEAR